MNVCMHVCVLSISASILYRQQKKLSTNKVKSKTDAEAGREKCYRGRKKIEQHDSL